MTDALPSYSSQEEMIAAGDAARDESMRRVIEQYVTIEPTDYRVLGPIMKNAEREGWRLGNSMGRRLAPAA